MNNPKQCANNDNTLETEARTMDKTWLKSYPPGVPAEIDPGQYDSLVRMFEDSFSRFATRNAFVSMDKYLTYGELDRYSSQMAAWLQSRGMQKGARVAVMMPNVLQYPIALVAILRAGYTVVNVNPLYTARELEHHSRARIVWYIAPPNELLRVIKKIFR